MKILGIDLGTTNCTVAYLNEGKITNFPIEQSVDTDMIQTREQLPSFCFFPLDDEEPLVGLYAKERGAELPDRVISSAKSWLCHTGIDRRSPFLPLGPLETKLSPVQVLSRYLTHIQQAFGSRFEEHTLLVTVPASFDPDARELVQEAVGDREVILIEEPLASFYAWLSQYEASWREYLKVGDIVLVVDIGGGTTDFTLISVMENEGNLVLKREAVGEHLLLGGDNLDLALAYFAKEKFGVLDEWQFQSLVPACRRAKERLLEGSESETVTLQGRGSSLIGGMQTAELTSDEVKPFLMEGYFPLVDLDEPRVDAPSSALQELSLPYVQDPRITAQLAHFLRGKRLPTKVLFNGGTLKALPFQDRLIEQLQMWSDEKVVCLPGQDLDHSVSRGAVYYGQVRVGEGIRVRAGVTQNYYVGVERARLAVPGIPPEIVPHCIVPKGLEEGESVTLNDQVFTLTLGHTVRFPFFAKKEEEMHELHPIEMEMEGEGVVQVRLKARVTEMGALQLFCVSDSGKEWKLQFDLRSKPESAQLEPLASS